MSLLLPKSSDNYCKYRLRLSLRGRFRPWQSLQKRRDCGAYSEYSEKSCSGLLRLCLATSLAMTILIAGFGYLITFKNIFVIDSKIPLTKSTQYSKINVSINMRKEHFRKKPVSFLLLFIILILLSSGYAENNSPRQKGFLWKIHSKTGHAFVAG